MKGLPDCPHCDAAQTLELLGYDSRDVRVALCSCCGRVCRVNEAGAVVEPEPRTDISGRIIDGP